jgi:putative ABC transport system ATP-binding protein
VPASDTTAAPAAACRRVSVDYVTEAGVVHALREVDAIFAPGRVTVLAGPSGSGKSSLLRVLAGLQRPRSGRVEVAGTDLTGLRPGALRRLRRRHVGVVLQEPDDNLIAYLSAAEQLRLAARLRGVDAGEAPELLAAAGLADRAGSRPAELSGGEQQRVAFAAAAIGRPALLLADEPTAELDAAAAERLVGTVRGLAARGSTVVVTSHDAAVIEAADHLVVLRDGRVAAA